MKSGMNIELPTAADTDGRPIRFLIAAGQVRDYTGAAALLSGRPKAEWLFAVRGYDVDWFSDALKEKMIMPCIRSRKLRGKPIKQGKRRYRSEIMLGRRQYCRIVATRDDRCPKPSSSPSRSLQPTCSAYEARRYPTLEQEVP